LGLAEHGLGMAVHGLADVGHRETTRGALQQPHPQLGLQLADPPAEAGLGDPERPLGGGEPGVLHHHGEVVQVVQVVHPVFPRWNEWGYLSSFAGNPSAVQGRIDSTPPMYGRSTSGTVIDPSSCCPFSITAISARPTA